MVVASLATMVSARDEMVLPAGAGGIPTIDLSGKRQHVSQQMVRACEEHGFFKVTNHGVPLDVVSRVEAAALGFFSLPAPEKQRAGPAMPLGYGSRSIGLKGDAGEVEYLLLHASPSSVAQKAKTIWWRDPVRFSCILNEYEEAVRELACEILDMLGEGLGIGDRKAFSRLIGDKDSDSLIRINHYPAVNNINHSSCTSPSTVVEQQQQQQQQCPRRVGFGEHSDPQILTLLRSNNVPGLEILSGSGTGGGGGGPVWLPVPPDPASFCVNVGDTLQALTNGRFVSVRHRAMANPHKSRLSLVYFGAPSLDALISPLPEMVTTRRPCAYRPFTWGEYKKAMYALPLGHKRLDLFRRDAVEEEEAEPQPQPN